jgi:hypothetical protein
MQGLSILNLATKVAATKGTKPPCGGSNLWKSESAQADFVPFVGAVSTAGRQGYWEMARRFLREWEWRLLPSVLRT